MSLIDELQEKIEGGEFEFSKHAVDQSIIRCISVQEVREALARAELVEDYPDDRLTLGRGDDDEFERREIG